MRHLAIPACAIALALGACNGTPAVAPATPSVAYSADRSQVAVNRTLSAENGKTIRVGFMTAVNPDCSLLGMPTGRVITPPAHGEAVMKEGDGFTNFTAPNIRVACNTKREQGLVTSYTAQRGFVGTDSFEYETFVPSGARIVTTVNLNVF